VRDKISHQIQYRVGFTQKIYKRRPRNIRKAVTKRKLTVKMDTDEGKPAATFIIHPSFQTPALCPVASA